MNVILDTDVLVDLAHGKAEWLEELIKRPGRNRIIVPTAVVAEYWGAAELDDKENLRKAEKLFKSFVRQELTEEIAKLVGTLNRHKDYPAGASFVDLVVASTAITMEARLATRNKKHFAKIPGLDFFEEVGD